MTFGMGQAGPASIQPRRKTYALATKQWSDSVGLNDAFLTSDDLQQFGFRKLGRDVRIHPTVVIVDCSSVSIGDHVRIDPFTVLSAMAIEIGTYVHIASHCALVGRSKVALEDFVNLSPGARILTSNDDFTGKTLVGPLVPEELRHVHHAPVIVRAHGLIGSGSVVLPGVTIGEGCSVGALSLVKQSLEPWGIYAGVPVRRIKDRARDIGRLGSDLMRKTAASSRTTASPAASGSKN